MMKQKIFTILFSLVLAICLLAGCGEVAETGTDVNSLEATQQTVQQPSSDSENEVVSQLEEEKEPVQTQSAVPSKDEKKETIQTQSVVQSLGEDKQPEETTSSAPSGNNNGTAGDEPETVPPGFTSMAGFHSWLQKGGEKEDVREGLINNANKLSTFTATQYCRPKLGDGNETFVLSKIEAYAYKTIYRYRCSNNSNMESLKIIVYVDPLYMRDAISDMEKRYKEINSVNRKFDQYGEYAINGTTYYFYYYSFVDSAQIFWESNGSTYYASYDGDYSQIKEILPMLELEQVNYKLSTGAGKES